MSIFVEPNTTICTYVLYTEMYISMYVSASTAAAAAAAAAAQQQQQPQQKWSRQVAPCDSPPCCRMGRLMAGIGDIVVPVGRGQDDDDDEEVGHQQL
jgi:hypothetical protein